MMYGTTNTDEARGCPDSDQDGTPDPQDAFPEAFKIPILMAMDMVTVN